jgi:hypothetical protein
MLINPPRRAVLTEGTRIPQLERYVRETLLPRAPRHHVAAQGAGDDPRSGAAPTVRNYVPSTLDTGHYDPDDKPPFKDGKPGGWHKADASIWNDLGGACIPHAAL